MRAYFFSHSFLMDKHQGVQNNHSINEVWLKYSNLTADGKKYQMLVDWARDFKTTIFLAGGNSARLKSIEELLSQSPYPNASFREDEDTLEGILTSVCVVVPTHIWEAAEWQRSGYAFGYESAVPVHNGHALSQWDLNFIRLCNDSRLL